MEILSLGEKIKQRRKELNMTLKDLAGEKVTPGQISLVESGKSKPSIDLLEYMAQKLKVSIDSLLETEEHQAEKLCEYYAKITDASLLAENYEQARESINKGMAYALQYDLEYYKGLNELYTGKIEFGYGNLETAQSMFITANETFFRTGKMRNVVETYIYLGMTTYELSYYNSALNFYKQAERILEENKIIDDDILMNIYFNISLCHSKLGNHSATIDYLLLTMEKLKQKNDKYQYGQSLLMLSISYKSLNRFEEAFLYANSAISVFKELNNQAFLARVETNMGGILSEIGNIEDSFRHLENAYKIKLDTNDNSIIRTILLMVDNHIKEKDYDKALNILLDLYEKYNDECYKEYRPSIYHYLYNLYSMIGDIKSAEFYLLDAVKYLQNMDMPLQLADTYIMLGEFYGKTGNSGEAINQISRGINIYKENGIILNKKI
ncbi:transcriptional activator NprA [Oxobacter pfennigii]|uniref:Transcriptional activator NprA n=1 Tax=Oxobacter pfennigii TaxID=36849 RepID=A0A0P8YAX0_9CLOT|nr:helix-turn-helix domain-containing protein [Oxobacter pfennigii]KPU44175.1 transcriptional activator NprA [Oxobacter pfennigii]